jgi:hypothetical protein
VGKARPASRADNSAVPVVPNVKARMEAQHSILPLGLQDLLRESFTSTFYNFIFLQELWELHENVLKEYQYFEIRNFLKRAYFTIIMYVLRFNDI